MVGAANTLSTGPVMVPNPTFGSPNVNSPIVKHWIFGSLVEVEPGSSFSHRVFDAPGRMLVVVDVNFLDPCFYFSGRMRV